METVDEDGSNEIDYNEFAKSGECATTIVHAVNMDCPPSQRP